jgi:hypothetical protein
VLKTPESSFFRVAPAPAMPNTGHAAGQTVKRQIFGKFQELAFFGASNIKTLRVWQK